jgi:two-component system chemotaxis sensor kinase CheA
MLSALNTFSRSQAHGTSDVRAFLQGAVVDGIDRIKTLFPNQTDLVALDTNGFEGDDAEPAAAEPEGPAASSDGPLPADDIDALLADLPTFDDSDRQSLLSKSLDDAFSSMRNGNGGAADDVAAELDTDPIAMQFSSPSESSTVAPPPDEFGEADEAMGIIDDFGAETAPDGLDDADTGLSSDDAADDVDLWPKAEQPPLAAPPEPVADSRTVASRIDFSAPADPEDAPAESEGFVARSSIRKSIRVDADKVDDLMDQVGELVVNRSSFMQLFEDMRELTQYLTHRFAMGKDDQRLVAGLTSRLSDATTVLGRVSTELQEQVMKVRMLPISRLFNRYPRLVHDLVKTSDKKIQLQLRGEETELDRMVIEQLADPMIHIIRNAVDHGIEDREERQRKGKPQSGVLLLEAYHEGSNVIIEVTDDGGGIDLSRIRQKAVEKQLADRESLERMDQQALIDMIMLPGFSTTDRVTHTSGRGVGMDVVKRSIEKINGSLSVDTRQDVGTRFRIKIPLTLAIIPALMIRCAGSHFTVPLSAVEETLRIDRGELFTVDGSEVMHLHEEPLPLVRMSELLNLPATGAAVSKERLFVVVINAATGRTGFVVDALLGRQEVVIKPLEDYLQENSGFSGATILGDGSISLILDVDELVTMAKERETERKLAAVVL